MLSLPDFEEKQVLFIRAERGVSCRIKFQNDNIVFVKDDQVVNRASCHKVFAVFVVGDLSVTTQLMKNAVEHGVTFFFLKPNMTVYASVNAAAEGHYLLKQTQYRMPAERELEIGKGIVENKIKNQASLLKSIKQKGQSEKLNALVKNVRIAKDQSEIRGIEGTASKTFFGAYFEPLDWRRRVPRAKDDVPNFLLDIGYTLSFNMVDSLLRLFGFDTYKGCYHQLFFQRKSLSCDIVEPFRCIIDKQLRKSFNLGQVNEKDFTFKKQKVVAVDFSKTTKYSAIFSEALMDRKEDLYLYVRDYYRHVMDGDKNPFPKFDI